MDLEAFNFIVDCSGFKWTTQDITHFIVQNTTWAYYLALMQKKLLENGLGKVLTETYW